MGLCEWRKKKLFSLTYAVAEQWAIHNFTARGTKIGLFGTSSSGLENDTEYLLVKLAERGVCGDVDYNQWSVKIYIFLTVQIL